MLLAEVRILDCNNNFFGEEYNPKVKVPVEEGVTFIFIRVSAPPDVVDQAYDDDSGVDKTLNNLYGRFLGDRPDKLQIVHSIDRSTSQDFNQDDKKNPKYWSQVEIKEVVKHDSEKIPEVKCGETLSLVYQQNGVSLAERTGSYFYGLVVGVGQGEPSLQRAGMVFELCWDYLFVFQRLIFCYCKFAVLRLIERGLTKRLAIVHRDRPAFKFRVPRSM